jgi:hypothetical protein
MRRAAFGVLFTFLRDPVHELQNLSGAAKVGKVQRGKWSSTTLCIESFTPPKNHWDFLDARIPLTMKCGVTNYDCEQGSYTEQNSGEDNCERPENPRRLSFSYMVYGVVQ